MLCRLTLFGILALALAGCGPQDPSGDTDGSPNGKSNSGTNGRLGHLIAGERLPERSPAPLHQVLPAGARAPVVIPDAHITVIDKHDVPSERDGTLLFIATEIAPNEQVPPNRLITLPIGFLAIELARGEQVAPHNLIRVTTERGEVREFRPFTDGDKAEPGKLIVARQARQFRRLKEGDEVKEGQLLALVDPALALEELGIKRAKLDASEADWKASLKTRDEAEQRYNTMQRLWERTPSAVPLEELRGAKLTWDRYFFEEVSKKQAIDLAKNELNQSYRLLKMHEIHSKIPGVIKTIFKSRGESVKNLEAVFQIQNPSLVRIEGLVEYQYLDYLPKGSKIWVEPARPERPLLVLNGHLQEITAVAVSNDLKDPVIVSASEDTTVRVWDRNTGRERYILRHPASVRTVACTPAGAEANLCVSGSADGTGRLWNLNSKETPEPVELSERHKGAINCAAFSLDGKWCATGGEDRIICLWDAANGKLQYRFEAGHRGRVTSLQFTPNYLVSAGADNTILLWKVGDERAELEKIRFDRRSGDVSTLRASPDGTKILFEQSKELRILSVPEGRTEAVLQNPSGSSNFSTLAMFSPNGKTIMAAGAYEGRVQLWRVPTDQDPRAYELRQLVWAGSPTTCGAFSPDSSFAVTGTKDRQVLVWPMPTVKEIDEKPSATITLSERSLDSNSRQVRIWAEMNNQDGLLIPGSTATMVAYPNK